MSLSCRRAIGSLVELAHDHRTRKLFVACNPAQPSQISRRWFGSQNFGYGVSVEKIGHLIVELWNLSWTAAVRRFDERNELFRSIPTSGQTGKAGLRAGST